MDKHSTALNNLCRVCSQIIGRKIQKYECEQYRADLKEHLDIEVKQHDPKYFCKTCYIHIFVTIKKQHNKNTKFLKRLWQIDCNEQCDTCYIYSKNQNGGRTFKGGFHTQSSRSIGSILPDCDNYNMSCGVCVNVVDDGIILSCGHIECSGCVFLDKQNIQIKCSKCLCLTNTENVKPFPTQFVSNLPSICNACKMKGPFDSIKQHDCGKDKSFKHLTVSRLLSMDEECQEGAKEVATAWLPRLSAGDGKFVAKSPAGHVSFQRYSFNTTLELQAFLCKIFAGFHVIEMKKNLDFFNTSFKNICLCIGLYTIDLGHYLNAYEYTAKLTSKCNTFL